MGEDVSDKLSIFLAVECSIGNPVSRFIVNSLSKKKNGRSLLEEALVTYCNLEKIPLLEKLKTLPLCAILGLGRTAFGADKNMMKEYFRDPVARRGLVNVMQSIGKYGIHRPFKLIAPFLVVWNYTNACNLKCQHCYQKAKKPLPDELSTEEKLGVVQQLADNNVVALAFSGGEPLLAPDFFEVAAYASQQHLYLSLATNGTLLTKKNVNRIVEAGIRYVEISLDSANPHSHEHFRGVRGCWEKTLEGIRNAVEHEELFVCLATTITRYNHHEVPALIKLSERLGVKRFLAFNFIPTGKATDIREADLTPQMREELLETLYKHMREGSIEVMTTAPQFARICMSRSKDTVAMAHFGAGTTSEKTRLLAEFLGGCGAGRLYCAIQPNGVVTPCVYMPIEIGNLREKTLQEIWKQSEIMQELREREQLLDNCGRCSFKNVCGGCRARAYAYTGNISGCDPGCIRNTSINTSPTTPAREHIPPTATQLIT